MSDQPENGEIVEEHDSTHERAHVPAVRETESIVMRDEYSLDDVKAQVEKVQGVMENVMTDGEHFGVIPGTNKPTLLKPGAEKLCLTFRLDPEYKTEKHWFDDGHLTCDAVCTLYHIPTGKRIASGVALCTTRETKYAYRKAQRSCPECGAEAVIRGKAEFGGGFLCWKKRDGCGAKFSEDDQRIVSQPEGRIDNPDLPDTYNTVIKIACKRALVAAVLNGTAASDIFSQDLEDQPDSAADTPSLATGEQRQRIKVLRDSMDDPQVQEANTWFKDTKWKMDTLTAEQAAETIAALERILATSEQPDDSNTVDAEVVEDDEPVNVPKSDPTDPEQRPFGDGDEKPVCLLCGNNVLTALEDGDDGPYCIDEEACKERAKKGGSE